MEKIITKKKALRKIIRIDEDKCTGCGECIPNCPEGALQIIDNKVRLISDLFCDGLGACIGHCPEGAISTEEREAEPYEEKTVMVNIVKQGANTIKAHLRHLEDHNQEEYLRQAIDFLNEKHIKVPLEDDERKAHPLPCGCPGSSVRSFAPKPQAATKSAPSARAESQLAQWPVQLMLVPPGAPFLKNSDLVIAADCVSYAYANFHQDFLKGKALLIACPKLDDTKIYLDKLTQMFKTADIKSITLLHMEVPCCFGLVHLVKQALAASGREIPTKEVTISIQGEVKNPESIRGPR
ncbi:MAG: 4Fe-4S binding protein [Planctomycetota bacterium]